MKNGTQSFKVQETFTIQKIPSFAIKILLPQEYLFLQNSQMKNQLSLFLLENYCFPK